MSTIQHRTPSSNRPLKAGATTLPLQVSSREFKAAFKRLQARRPDVYGEQTRSRRWMFRAANA